MQQYNCIYNKWITCPANCTELERMYPNWITCSFFSVVTDNVSVTLGKMHWDILLINSVVYWQCSIFGFNSWFICIFFGGGAAAQRGLWPPHFRGFFFRSHTTDATQSVGLLWTSDQLVAETSTWQHSQETDIHALGGIRTHNLSRRAAAELRLRPRGYWHRRFADYHNTGLFVSPSGISELDCATTKTDTAERSIK